jgi:F-type H+-transporting ATPase subunit b
MESMLAVVGEIVLTSLPTLILLIILHLYLKKMLFQPLERAMDARRAATDGVRKLAEESLAKAEQKAAEYEEALRHTRNEIYKEQEAIRQTWRRKQTDSIAEMRRNADSMIREGRSRIETECAGARALLQVESESLSEQIAGSILSRRNN